MSDEQALDATFTADEKESLAWHKNAEFDDHLFDPFAAVHRANDQMDQNAKNSLHSAPRLPRFGGMNVGHVVSADSIARREAVQARHDEEIYQQQQKQRQLPQVRDRSVSNNTTTSTTAAALHHPDHNPTRHIPARFQRFSSATISIANSRPQSALIITTPSASPDRIGEHKDRSLASVVCKTHQPSSSVPASSSPSRSIVAKSLPPHDSPSSTSVSSLQNESHEIDDQHAHSFMDRAKSYVPGQRPLSGDVSPRASRLRHEHFRQSQPQKDPSANVCLRIMEKDGGNLAERMSTSPEQQKEQQNEREAYCSSPRNMLPRLEMVSPSRPGTASMIIISSSLPSPSQKQQPTQREEVSPYLVIPIADQPTTSSHPSKSRSVPQQQQQQQHRNNHKHHLATLEYPDPIANPFNRSSQARQVILQQKQDHQRDVFLQSAHLTQSQIKGANKGMLVPLSVDSDGVFTEDYKNIASMDVPPKTVDRKRLRYELVSSAGVHFPETLKNDIMNANHVTNTEESNKEKR